MVHNTNTLFHSMALTKWQLLSLLYIVGDFNTTMIMTCYYPGISHEQMNVTPSPSS